MDLPSSRELELEALLTRRDAQVTELTDEVTHLRQYLSTQPGPSTTELISLPPALVSLLLPHLGATRTDGSAGSASSTVTTALTQRAKLLQDENDELYELLKSTETGKLKEEVKGLRRAVDRLETALRESHQVIKSLSDELDKSYEAVLPPPGRQYNNANVHQPAHVSRPLHQQPPHMITHSTSNGSVAGNGNGNGSSKPVPTGPRAHKKPRLSDARASPSSANSTLPRIQTAVSNRSTSRHMDSPEHSPLLSPDHRKVPGGKVEMAVDDEPEEDQRPRVRSPAPKERERGKERDKERTRDKERDRDRDRTSRRNGGHGGRRSGRSGGASSGYASGDRTLAERMGL